MVHEAAPGDDRPGRVELMQIGTGVGVEDHGVGGRARVQAGEAEVPAGRQSMASTKGRGRHS